MNIPHDGVVVVADGRKMLMFRNRGNAASPDLQLIEGQEQPNPAHRDQATDQSGRAAGTVGSGSVGRDAGAFGRGGAGGTMTGVDFHQQEEDRFAAMASDMLRQRALAGGFEHLIIVAPPRTLGEMRKHYHKELAGRIAAEVPKDLSNHPTQEIARILAATE